MMCLNKQLLPEIESAVWLGVKAAHWAEPSGDDG